MDVSRCPGCAGATDCFQRRELSDGRSSSPLSVREERDGKKEETEEEEVVKEGQNRVAFTLVLVSRKTIFKSGEEWDGGVGVAKYADPDAAWIANTDCV